ncbi:type VI secretion system membrane subunit TssM [Herbaspirillum sp. RTI4]|uniref:type VI secretion system membrane subunit TssM n=1 Tax=Herbaspirillum sp. RTI4 TaxID=3048640 RepID=UPI002AB52A91|nr:type VI secretion system membrane subunit TssM [Herbaspirillum sp. RTI4]MDY7579039.1 type VI secretion system membrane subunit TssM [Herbaspirillum sp. RTI4]MEA9982376.1 type VI secretion system membrane subunit TssM [Herbaspirillum sp. RTI4]
MQAFWKLLTHSRTLTAIGCVALAAILYLGASSLGIGIIGIVIILCACIATGGLAWWYERYRTRRDSANLNGMLETQAETGADKPDVNETDALRTRMLSAISRIKNSRLGEKSGATALYELPWYMVIGNPAAGKSSAISNSGLHFPLQDKNSHIVQGVGGTRNCDWFFTTNGILLDTAGRYSVSEKDRSEWFNFLGLLKKYRSRAPINGIIIAVSIAELISSRPEVGEELAKNLRERVHELTERLEVYAPVYIMFTKTDLVSGFTEFFQEMELTEQDRVWGATVPYSTKNTPQDVLAHFDMHFDRLYEGLKEISLANMSFYNGDRMPPAIFTFPLEFAAIKPVLHTFMATLFEDNRYQFKPVFRGFYFTSAKKEGTSSSTSSERVAHRFNLNVQLFKLPKLESEEDPVENTTPHGLFLRNLFEKVIFPDKDLVRQYASRHKMRLRYAFFFGAAILLGLSLAGWSWSYIGNRQLADNVQADLDKAIKLQEKRLDLQSRLEAMEILQDRIEQLQKFNRKHPLSLGFGLYQGELLSQKLREEYFSGIREIVLKPVAFNIETFLTEMNTHADALQPMSQPMKQANGSATDFTQASAAKIDSVSRVTTVNTPSPTQSQQPYTDASPSNVEDAYNALKTYLMLADKTRAESGHLNDQITRFWRAWLESNRGNMPREQMIRSAERLMTFYLSQINDPSWPTIDNQLTLVDQSRDNLRRVVRGMAARDRVYADIKARASTRFPSVTVSRLLDDQDKELVLGSYAISGAFTREAWEKYVQDAFRDAANKELQSADWVLKTATNDDLTLEGSPEQIQKALVMQYKTDYAREWQKFVQGVSIPDLVSFDNAVKAMNRFGDPSSSPINKLVTQVHQETSWDNPTSGGSVLQQASSGWGDWFSQTILRRSPAPVVVNTTNTTTTGSSPMGPVGKEFSGVARMLMTKDNNASLMRGYMDTLSKLRTRFNQIKNQGDTGPGANQLMQQTLNGNGSELADALKYVDEQMLTGMSDSQKQAIRPVLVRPLIQAFAVTVVPTEAEINRTWLAQVYAPFKEKLADKYPFSSSSKIEATSSEIGQIFGPEGSIAKFVNASMGPLVIRRGDALAAKTWADMGIHLSPAIVSNFSRWVGPLGANGAGAAGNSGSAPAEAQTMFQILALPASGTLEYTIEIDGQQLRYRNTQSQWTNFIWPNPQGTPGARITAVTFDGRTIEIANQPGRFGLERLINSATRTKKDGTFELSWSNEKITVPINLKIISSPQVSAKSADGSVQQNQGFRGMVLPETIVGAMPEVSPARINTGVQAQ